MGLLDILSNASKGFSSWLGQGEQQEPSSLENVFGRTARRVGRALPRETQQVPVANALDFSNFKDMYGREPRMGELQTENVNPASYVAGQVSGTNVAGGAPGPRYGQIRYDPIFEGTIQRAMDKLPVRVQDFLKRTPMKIDVSPLIPQEYKTAYQTTSVPGGYQKTPTSQFRMDFRQSPIKPTWSEVKANMEEPDIERVLAHELSHAAQSSAGLEGRGLPGLRFTEPGQKFMGEHYNPRNRPEELAASGLVGGEYRRDTPGPLAEVFDENMFGRALEKYYPKLETPAVFEAKQRSIYDLPEESQMKFPFSKQNASEARTATDIPEAVLNHMLKKFTPMHTDNPIVKEGKNKRMTDFLDWWQSKASDQDKRDYMKLVGGK